MNKEPEEMTADELVVWVYGEGSGELSYQAELELALEREAEAVAELLASVDGA